MDDVVHHYLSTFGDITERQRVYHTEAADKRAKEQTIRLLQELYDKLYKGEITNEALARLYTQLDLHCITVWRGIPNALHSTRLRAHLWLVFRKVPLAPEVVGRLLRQPHGDVAKLVESLQAPATKTVFKLAS